MNEVELVEKPESAKPLLSLKLDGTEVPAVKASAADMEVAAGMDVAAGRTSFSEFYASSYQAMLALAVMLLGDRALAEDVTQDAFVGAHRQWARIENPTAYLRRSIANGATSQHRRRFRDRRRPSPREESSALEADEMFDALSTLVPRQRAALVLRYWFDLSDAQIAEVLQVRTGTVASLIHRGLEELRKVVKP